MTIYFNSSSQDNVDLRNAVRGTLSRGHDWERRFVELKPLAESDVRDCGRQLAALGLLGVLLPGMGSAMLAVGAAAEAARALTPFPVIDAMATAPLFAKARPDLLDRLLSGGMIIVAHHDIPWMEGNGVLAATFDLAFPDQAEWLVSSKGGRTMLVPIADCDIADRQDLLADPSRPAARVSVEVAVSQVIFSDEDPRPFLALLASAELTACAETLFERGIDHLNGREQFGRVLAANQALRHNAAVNWVDISNMQMATAEAAALLDLGLAEGSGIGPEAAIAVRAAAFLAAERARPVAEDVIQYHGGLGYSWETGLHLYLRRILRLTSSCGTALEHAAGLVRAIARDGLPLRSW